MADTVATTAALTRRERLLIAAVRGETMTAGDQLGARWTLRAP